MTTPAENNDIISHASLDGEEEIEVLDGAFLWRLAVGEHMSVQYTRLKQRKQHRLLASKRSSLKLQRSSNE